MILVDGGVPQVNAIKKVLNKNIFVLGIAKGKTRKKNELVFGSKDKEFIDWVNKNKDILVRVRDEAHRFAIKYQRELSIAKLSKKA
jgi:excinuclease ABC subunit C